VQAAASLEFLRRIQLLLDEGEFAATYKFALLRALADLSIEQAPAADGSLRVTMGQLADRFVEYYWRQGRPYRLGRVLQQNNTGQARVISEIMPLMGRYRTVAELRSDGAVWPGLRATIARNIRDNPVRFLQNLPSGRLEFLYALPSTTGRRRPVTEDAIVLKPGVPQGFRVFHALIISLVEAGWIRQIAAIRTNREQLGSDGDLAEFLFGSPRQSLANYLAVLHERQGGLCFYCEGRPRRPLHLDHFVAWSRYPTDLGHNFVAACPRCNAGKSSHLAATVHLAKWRAQNIDDADGLAAAFSDRSLPHDAARSRMVASWAYEQAEQSGAATWVGGRDFEPLGAGWREALWPQPHVASPGALLPMAAEERGSYDAGE
jgi:5-methylcytosine-specific restriction endonuclease McrA